MKQKLTIATRTSPLALRQAHIVKDLLLQHYPSIDVVFLEITTAGDIDQTTPLSAFGNTGVFVKGLERKLLSGEADLAVHSLKDVPADADTEFSLVAYPQRADVRDVLVTADGKPLKDLKLGAVVGTSSPARQEQLKLLRPDLKFENIRGNVGTRIQKVKDGLYDATILAAAGMKRLGHTIPSQSFFSLDQLVPSPGQGALAIQVQKDNNEVIELLQRINQPTIQTQVEAERRFMQVIGGGCRYPVAAHAEIIGDKVIFRAIAHKPNFKALKKIEVETTLEHLLEVAEKSALEMLKKQ